MKRAGGFTLIELIIIIAIVGILVAVAVPKIAELCGASTQIANGQAPYLVTTYNENGSIRTQIKARSYWNESGGVIQVDGIDGTTTLFTGSVEIKTLK